MPGPSLRHLAAVALLAGGGLAYEIALTRLLSALLVSSWVAPVLAVALLGLGLGAGLAALLPAWRSPMAAQVAAGAAAVLTTLSLPAWLWAAAASVPLIGLLLPLLAYLALGLAGAAIFSWWPQRAAGLVRTDYAAAALAAIATPIALAYLGGLGGALAAATLLGVAALCLRPSASGARLAAASMATGMVSMATPALAALAMAVGALDLDPATHLRAKPIAPMLQRGGVIEASRWDATARTDLLRMPDGARYLFMDGGAGSLVPDPDPDRWWHDVGAFAFAMATAQRAFLIGTGGGLDVAQARANGVADVTAVEVNAASIELVRGLRGAAGRVYDAPTEVVLGDGRRALARTAGDFDLIALANVVTGAAELRGAALTENLVYTVEAFETYLGRLSPDGRLALKLYDELTLTRALTTALEALVRSGLAPDHAAATLHLFAVLDTRAQPPIPLLAVRRSPFDLGEAVASARVAEARGWGLLMVPELLVPATLQGLVDGSQTLAELIAAGGEVDLRPTFDDRPYFFAFEPGLPRDVQRAGWLAVGTLLILVAAAPLVGRRGGARRGAARRWLAAAALGAGFLLLELHALHIIQRAAGHPAWSLSLTLGAVLLGGAIGAHLSGRSAGLGARRPALLAAAALLAWVLLAPVLLGLLLPAAPQVAGLALAALLLVAAVPMGMPFPRLLAGWGTASGVAAALAASGVAAVAAGSGALFIAHALGMPWVGMIAVSAYFLAAVVHPGQS